MPDAKGFKSNPLEWFPLRVDDFLLNPRVATAPPAAVGILTLALCYAWRVGSIPGDPDTLAKMLRQNPNDVKAHWDIIVYQFAPDPNREGWLYSPYIAERLKQGERAQAERSARGKKAAAARWKKAAEEAKKGGKK